MWTNVHANDFGWVGKLRVVQDGAAVDISTYTTRQFILRSPVGAISTKTAIFDTDGADGVLKYTFVDGDIPRAGNWSVQARIIKNNVELTTNELRFFVAERLDD
jgi:hypothetical protein